MAGKGGKAGAPRKAASRQAAGPAAPRSAAPRREAGRRGEGALRPQGGRQAAPRGLGGEQVEGRQAVRELLLAGRRRVLEILVVDRDGDSDRFDDDELTELARDLRVPVRAVGRGRLASMARSEAPQGVIALAEPLREVELLDLTEPGPGGSAPFLVVLDGVTDPGNLGAVLRAAECAGVTGVVLPRHRAVHITPTVAKAAAGAIEHLPMALVGGLPAALSELSSSGVWTVGLDAGGDVSVWDLGVADGPVALVLGAEGSGLSRLVRQRCDQLAAIPLVGVLGSLNVATASAVACYEVARRRLRPSGGSAGVGAAHG